jgi:catechol 2,3-dioxygenase-like lactoylglutathione lyase family enzyme
MKMETTKLRKVHPVLQVSDVRRGVKFYVDCLGFEIGFFMGSIEPVPWAGVCRDGIEIYLELVDLELVDAAALTPTHLRFLVDDPDALFRELSEQGKIDPLPPVRYGRWDTRELSISDPDGNLLTFYRMLVDDELK